MKISALSIIFTSKLGKTLYITDVHLSILFLIQ